MTSTPSYYIRLFLILIASVILSACSPKQTPELLNMLPENSQQALVVTNTKWEENSGILRRFEKVQGDWKAIGNDVPVMLGRNGLAWGKGLHIGQKDSFYKQEGDGKAPAGIFKLGTSFGYADQALEGQDYPYQQATVRDYFVDDVTSTDYNRWITIPESQENTPKAHWKSFEKMRRDDALYELGLVIEHNSNPVEAKAGSAIFMHVWKDSQTDTSGCVSMEKSNLTGILQWLDAEKQPLFIMAPTGVLDNIELSPLS
jgi:L,D-peptidoglycan transpeptidase YkuD (ErfK/YbiS/YcfS/YnhG family)